MGLVQNLKFKAHSPDGIDPDRLAKIIEDAYLSKNRNWTTTKKTFSPSSIGYGQGRCPRYWYLAFSGAKFIDSNNAAGIANMQNGTYAHQRLQSLLADVDIVEEIELEALLEDPPVRGFIDFIFDWDGKEVVGEFKTARQEVFMHRQNSMKPSPNHLLQILLYMHVRQTDQGVIIYENKNSQELLILPVELNKKNQAILDAALDWMKAVYSNWQSDNLPTRPFTRKSKECKGCPIRKQCWDKEPEGEVTIEAMSIPKL